MTWRTLAMPIGIGLMIVLALLRILDQPRREMLQALALVAAVCLLLWLATPILIGLGRLNLVIFFLVLVPLTVFAGIPIAFCFGIGDARLPALWRRGFRPRCWWRGSTPACRI